MRQSPAIHTAVLLFFVAAAAGGPPSLIYFEENGGSGNPRGLYNFDPSSGISTLRTTVDGSQRFFGLHLRPGTTTVFAAAVGPSVLYTMDLDTGIPTLIGAMGPDTIADIAFDPISGTLYGMGRNSPFTLYAIDPATGSATPLRTMNESVRCGMVTDDAGTFYAYSIDGVLSTFDPATGITTQIGNTPVGNVVEDAVFASDGFIYFTLFNGRIYQTDPATGINTLVGDSNMGNGLVGLLEEPSSAPICYANCDGSTASPILNVDDFTCFINEYAAAQSLPHAQQVSHYANCDSSTIAPALNVDDFTCFINQYAAGCD